MIEQNYDMEDVGAFYQARDAKQEVSMNLIEAEKHLRIALSNLGLSTTSDPHLKDTPRRIAKMWAEMITPDQNWEFTTFPVDGDSGMVLVRDIPFISICSHHFSSFTGTAHIAYIPKDHLAGLSKFPRALNFFAQRPQVQERLGQQVADYLVEKLDPLGVAVILKAGHSCMTVRGVKAHGSVTTTSCLRGVFHEEDAARKELFDLLGV